MRWPINQRFVEAFDLLDGLRNSKYIRGCGDVIAHLESDTKVLRKNDTVHRYSESGVPGTNY
jgi:hypothetical protein